MKRIAVNASPRGPASNSRRIIEWIAAGMERAGTGAPAVLDLARSPEETLAAVLAADEILLVFPLYTDFLPGILKVFFDRLAGLDPALLAGKRAAFVVHCGFPESAHAEPAAAWLERACARLGMVHAGTVIKGGSEGFRMMPPSMTRRVAESFAAAGESLGREGRFDPAIAARLAWPRRLGLPGRILVRLLKPTGLLDMYWKSMLKAKGGWERRFDRPYEPAGFPKT